jgi:phage terminase large subunit-like protein
MKHDKNIILKSRQLGISTLSAAYSLWLAMFHRDKSILVVATKQDVAKNLVTKVREMYFYLPQWLKGQVKTEENNKMSMRFLNGSQIKAVSSSGDSGRSEALSLLIIDECCEQSTKIQIRNKITGEIKNVNISDIFTDSQYL